MSLDNRGTTVALRQYCHLYAFSIDTVTCLSQNIDVNEQHNVNIKIMPYQQLGLVLLNFSQL